MTKLLLAALLFAATGSTARAAQYVTVLDTLINVDRIEMIQPIFCQTTPGVDLGGQCSFVVVFSEADYTTTVRHKDGYQASYNSRDKVTIAVAYYGGAQTENLLADYTNPAYKTKGEALRAVTVLRDLLPK